MTSLPNTSTITTAPTERTQRLAREFVQYLVVGGLAFLVDWFLLTRGISWGGLDYRLATAIGFTAGLAVNYTLCVMWVWRGSARSIKDFLVFSGIGLAGLGITEFGMWIGIGLLAFNPSPVKIVVSGFVLIWNFTLRKLVVFCR